MTMRLMIFKSIRWRLQIWYGIILLTVLTGFGFTAYQLERGQKFRRVDEELRQRANAIANAMRLPPRGPGPGRRFTGELELPPRLAALFDETDTNGFYYVIFARDGRELRRSTNAPA